MATHNSTDSECGKAKPIGSSSLGLADFVFSAEEKKRLELHLNDITENDPLEYRRIGIDGSIKHTHQSVSREDLRNIARLQDLFPEPIFTSHRKYLGPLIILYKKYMFKFLRRWMNLMMSRQIEMNQRLLNLAISVHVLENRIQNLEKYNQSQSRT